jgi:hypothetical protein
MSFVIATIAGVFLLPLHLRAQLPAPYFFDDFEDGSAEDDSPVKWIPWTPFSDGSRVVTDGSYTVTPGDQTPSLPGFRPERTEADSTVEGFLAQDVSIRSLISAPEFGDYWMGFGARDVFDDAGLNGSNVAAGIQPDGTIAIWTQRWTDQFVPETVVGFEESGLDLTETDVYLEFNVIGRDVSLKVWSEGEPKPSEPQITSKVLPSFVQEGQIGLFNYVLVDDNEKPVSFRHIAVLPTAISPTMPGDFDEDFLLTAVDIDLLASELRGGGTDGRFDSNYDGAISSLDHTAWVQHLAHTWSGDADLDGKFNSTDLVTVLAAGQYEDGVAGNSGWTTGDFDGDGDFTSSDLVVALADGGYEAGPRASAAAVPEPSSITALIGALSTLAISRRREA